MIAYHLTPFLPTTAKTIAEQLGVCPTTNAQREHAPQWSTTVVGAQVQPAAVLFPKHV